MASVDSFSPVFPLQPVNVVAWSPCGQFLAAACVGGSLTVWDVKSKLCVERYCLRAFTDVCQTAIKSFRSADISCLCCRQKHEKGFTVCCLAWHPSGGQIAYTDTEGRLGLLDGIGASGGGSSSKVQL